MKGGGQTLWNAVAICEMSKTSWQMAKTPFERRIGEPFQGPIIPFGAMVEYHPISGRDPSRLHQFGKKVLPGIFLGYALIAGGLWKGDLLKADLGGVEKLDASNIYPRRINAKEVLIKQKDDEFIRYSKIVRKRRRIPSTHSKAGTDREE